MFVSSILRTITSEEDQHRFVLIVFIFTIEVPLFLLVYHTSLNTKPSDYKVLQVERPVELLPEKNSSFSSDSTIESETILFRTIRSHGLFLCTFLFATNWFRIGIYFFPYIYPNLLVNSPSLCLLQSYFLHVSTLFHLNITISIHLFWHYCFVSSKYWQHITYSRLLIYLLCIFFFLCLLTWPIVSNEWTSSRFDRILQICTVNYAYHFSYTFFIVSLTCLLPFLALIISHHIQMNSMERRLDKYLSTFPIKQSDENSNIIDRKNQFQYASYVILIWSLINIILVICIHTPIDSDRMIKLIIFDTQMFAFIFDPILYIFIFRSVTIITSLRPTNVVH